MTSTTKVEVGARATLDRHREGVSQALAMRPGFDLADLSEPEFEAMLERERVRQDRIRRIIKNDLVEGEDYGSVPGIPKPFAWEGSADKILIRMRWTCRPVEEPALTLTEEVIAATVTVGVFDSMDRLVHSVPRSCSTMERRFRNQKTKKWKFDDPREALNEVVAMAFKRGKVAATLSAAAAKHFFANPDQLGEGEDGGREPWTEEQWTKFKADCQTAGIKTRADYQALIKTVVPTGDVLAVHVPRLYEALEAWKAGRATPVRADMSFDDLPGAE